VIFSSLRRYFGESITISWYIDDIAVEVGYKAPETTEGVLYMFQKYLLPVAIMVCARSMAMALILLKRHRKS